MIFSSIGLFFLKGLNYGIDFLGGITIEIRTLDGDADLIKLRKIMSSINLGDVQLQIFGAPNEVLIKIQNQLNKKFNQQHIINTIKKKLKTNIEYRRIEVVGPIISNKLIKDSVIALLMALLVAQIYIWIRFKWQFSIGAIIALLHDIIIIIGFFSLLQLNFNISIIAALITIIGYSLNDTVVIFDRIREYLKKFNKIKLSELLDLAINSTLNRTILTSTTTLLSLIPLVFFGNEITKGLSLAIICGVIIGTYSSIFIAAPILLLLNNKFNINHNNKE